MIQHDAKLSTALITGASTGIGATYADRLAKRGYNLILVARDEDRMQGLAARLRGATQVSVDIIKADLTTRLGRAAIEQRLNEDQSITMLVNNAGMAANGDIISIDADRLETMIELNVIAVTRLAAAAARNFVERKNGIIINLGSVTALMPERFSATYGGTKAFVLNLTQSLHEELSPHNIQVQAVLPGATRTEIWERAGTDINSLPASMLMEVDEMVDAALVGLDRQELVTIPSLSAPADWETFRQARLALGPHLSKDHAAVRYKEE